MTRRASLTLALLAVAAAVLSWLIVLPASGESQTCRTSLFCPDCVAKFIHGIEVDYCGLSRSNGYCECSGDQCSVISGTCSYDGGGGPPPV